MLKNLSLALCLLCFWFIGLNSVAGETAAMSYIEKELHRDKHAGSDIGSKISLEGNLYNEDLPDGFDFDDYMVAASVEGNRYNCWFDFNLVGRVYEEGVRCSSFTGGNSLIYRATAKVDYVVKVIIISIHLFCII